MSQRIADFLQDHLGYSPAVVEPLRRLAGRSLLGTRFLETVEESRTGMTDDFPIHQLMIGTSEFGRLAVHVRPVDVVQQRLPIVEERTPGWYVEVGATPRAYLWWQIADHHGDLQSSGSPLRWLDKELALVREVFGDDVYDPAAYGRFTEDDAWRLQREHTEGSAMAFVEWASELRNDPVAELAVLEQGRATFPHTMYFHNAVSQRHFRDERRVRSALAFVGSLSAYHHTAYSWVIDNHMDRGRLLLDLHPEAFPEDARTQVEAWFDDAVALEWSERLAKASHHDRSAKWLNDMGHRFGDYRIPVPSLRMLYRALGWRWALALLDLRFPDGE